MVECKFGILFYLFAEALSVFVKLLLYCMHFYLCNVIYILFNSVFFMCDCKVGILFNLFAEIVSVFVC